MRTIFIPHLILRSSHRSRETDPQSGFVQFGRAASNNEETRSDGDDEANTSRNENTPGDSGDGRRRDDDLNRAGSNNHGLNAVDEYKQHRGYKGSQKAGDGDGDGDGGGPTLMDGKWESQLHRTRVKLRLKLNAPQPYAVTIGYTFKVKCIFSLSLYYPLINSFSLQ